MLSISLLSPTALVLPSTTACRLPAASPLRVRTICMEEPIVKEPNLFTLEEQNDGFDDVRASIIAAKKDRAKALDMVKEKYGPGFKTASSWAKVLTTEVAGVELQAPDLKAPDLKMPKIDIVVPKIDVGKVVPAKGAKDALFGFLDGAAERKAAEKQRLADQKAAQEREERAAKSGFFRRK